MLQVKAYNCLLRPGAYFIFVTKTYVIDDDDTELINEFIFDGAV